MSKPMETHLLETHLPTYVRALREFMTDASEESLEQGSRLARAFLAEDLGVTDMVELHRCALDEVFCDGMADADILGAVRRTSQFLAESVSPFEMIMRGFRSANDRLNELNYTLEERVVARTAELEEARETYRRLLEKLPCTVYKISLGDSPSLEYVGPRVEEILGVDASSWTLDQWIERVVPEDRARITSAHQQAFLDERAYLVEYRMLTHGGDVVWIRDEAEVYRPSEDQPPQVHGVAINITDKRQLERQFLQAQKMEMVGTLAGSVAHDFNNVLSVILSFSQFAQSQVDEETPIYGDLQEIRKAAQRATGLTRQLLSFSRQQPTQREVIDLNALIGDMRTMLVDLVGENVHIELDLDDELDALVADPGQIEQVLMNLVVNARDAMPEGGCISLRTTPGLGEGPNGHSRFPDLSRDGHYVLLTVEDNGVGMTPEVQEKVLDPFFTTKSSDKGTGLGLTTCYNLVDQHNGRMHIESAVGRGTRIDIALPSSRHRPESTTGTKHRSLSARDATVLVVEDEQALRRASVRTLDQAGFTVVQAATQSQARAILETVSVDLLFTDVILAEGTGPALAEEAAAIQPDIQILFTTGYSGDELDRRGVDNETINLLHKPFEPDQLLDRVADMLRG